MLTKRKILIVDDEPEIIAELVEYFTDKGYQVTEASGGLEALDKFLLERTDVVITDIKMPRGSGDELIKRLRQMDRHLPIVAFTGYYSAEELAQARDAGATVTLTKPIAICELSDTLATLLEPGSEAA